MDSMRQKLDELHNVLERLAMGKDKVLEVADWTVTAATVEDTVLRDLLPPAERKKCITLLQKQIVQNDAYNSSYHNGDSSASSVSDLNDETHLSNGFGSHLTDQTLLAVEDARNMLSMYSLLHSPAMQANNHGNQGTPLLPLWIQCDGQDPERTVLVGCEQAQGSSQDPMPLLVIKVTCQGPIHSKSELLSLHEVILEGHEDAATKRILSQGFALFEVVGPMCGGDTTLAEATDSSYVAVECSWNGVKKILESPRDAICKVHIRAVPGDMRNTRLAVYKELSMLVMFAESLKTGEVSWVTKEKMETLQDHIKSLLAEVKAGPLYKKKLGEESEDNENQLCWKTAFDRSDLDFTERLWIILRDNATCYDDIKTAFTMVVNELNMGQIHPMIHGSNKTSLAQQIRLLYRDPAHELSLDQFPMELLVEIGVDKLQRDYIHFFIAQNLTTLRSLEWFVSASDLLTPADLVTRLQSLHCVLELSMLASESVGLPTNSILTLIRSALAHYRSNPPDDQHTFLLPVELTSVQNLYKNKLPTAWRVTTHSGGRSVKTSSVYQLGSEPLVEIGSHALPELTMDETTCDQEAFTYYATHVTRHSVHYP